MVPYFLAKLATISGKLNLFSKIRLGFILPNSNNKTGKIKKVTNREILTPKLIIQPKLITGNKPDSISELNPAIVVITVKKHGFIICTLHSQWLYKSI